MRILSAATLLNLWELGMGQSLVQRGLLPLQAACPELTAETSAQLSIGQRNHLLLQLRALTFGRQLEMQTTCPHCREPIEMSCTVADLLGNGTPEGAASFELTQPEYVIHYRLPNSLDLAAIADCRDLGDAQKQLLLRCLEAVAFSAEAIAADQLPDEIVAELLKQMELNDPQADIQLAWVCPSCGSDGSVAFDIVAYFWDEIHAWSQRMLRDIHTLARAYGWREADILALSPLRRQVYLELSGL